MSPTHETDHLISAFIQDGISITDTLELTIGTKLEHNEYTGIEVQPSARIAWTPNERHTLWAAVSRAVRTPSRAETDISIEFGELSSIGFPDVFATSFGSSDLDSTELIAFELGYRVVATERLAFDVALFYNLYDNVRSFVVGDVFTETDPPFRDVVPLLTTTAGDAQTWGVEIGADAQALPWWLLRATYSYIGIESDNVPEATGAREVPHHLISLQSRMDLPHDLEFDTTLRYAGDIDTIGIDAYVELDARLAWRPREDLELALVGRNLLDSQHKEYDDQLSGSLSTEVQRTVYGMIKWRF